MARGEHSTGPAPNDRMATKRLLRRKLKVAVMTALGLGRVKTFSSLERSGLGAVVIHGHFSGSTMPASPP